MAKQSLVTTSPGTTLPAARALLPYVDGPTVDWPRLEAALIAKAEVIDAANRLAAYQAELDDEEDIVMLTIH